MRSVKILFLAVLQRISRLDFNSLHYLFYSVRVGVDDDVVMMQWR